MIEVELARTIAQPGAPPDPSRGRVSRRVKSFPVAPRVDKGQIAIETELLDALRA